MNSFFRAAILPVGCLLLMGASCGDNPLNSSASSHDELTYYVDEGFRVEDASNPGAKLSDDDVLLLYENRVGHGNSIGSASENSDWLDFDLINDSADIAAFRALELPDGTYRAYGPDATKGLGGEVIGFTSKSSTDGENFTEDEGYRYYLQEEDYGSSGVYELFVDSPGNVVLLYIGNMGSKGKETEHRNTIRRAYSTDGGWTFEFDRGNILGGEDDVASHAYVDQKILSLGDDRWRLITMKQGGLYSFISEDDGYSFELEDFELTPEDFSEGTGYDIVGLHDPVMIQLPDGRFRIYVAAKTSGVDEDGGPKYYMLSATTRLD